MNKFLKHGLLSLALFSSAAVANISEPDVVFYGKITSRLGATEIALKQGNLTWEIHPKDDENTDRFVFATELESLANGMYSYKISIPQQVLVGVDTLIDVSPNTLTTESKQALFLKHYAITVNGEPAVLANDQQAFFSVDEKDNRASHRRLDLYVSNKALGDLEDSDDDGLPDQWESHFGLTLGSNDSDADTDGDGWTNLEEYEQGTDPTVNNRIPLLSGENGNAVSPSVTLYENGLVQLRLGMTDSDSQPEELSLSLNNLPTGLQIFHVDDMSQALTVGDSISAADLSEGKVFARYQPDTLLDEQGGAIEPGDWTVALHDSGPLHKPETETDESADSANEPTLATIKLNVFRPSSLADPVRWIDGMAYKGASVPLISGRSRQELDSLLHYHVDENGQFSESGNEIVISDSGLIQPNDSSDFSESGNDIVISDSELTQTNDLSGFFGGDMLAFKEPDDVSLRMDLSGDRSLFIVYEMETANGEVFNDGRIQLSEKSNHLTFGATSSQEAVVSAIKKSDGVGITAIHTQDGMSYLEHNSVQIGGPVSHQLESSTEASSLAGFGFAMGAYGTNSGYASSFGGQLGEFIAFSNVLDGMDKWAVNAFLLSKWKGYSIFDGTRSVEPVTFSASEALSTPVIMLGGIGNDILTANGQESILFGGEGADVLNGGDGHDRFIVTSGDTINGFTEYALTPINDVLDLSELLPGGDAALEKCLYFAPTGNNTTVSINTQCNGEDLAFGSDFTDAQFTIVGQGLWNTDIPILWSTGALFTGSHRPGHLQAQLEIGEGGSQYFEVKENAGLDGVRLTLNLSYTGGVAFSGEGLMLPFSISGTATPGEDYVLELPIDSDALKLINELSGNEYELSDFDDMSDSELESLGLVRTEEGKVVRFYNMWEFGLLELPHENGKIELDFFIKNDSTKEESETIIIKLGEIPEYYDLNPEKSEITISINDGLDNVYLTNTKTTVSEGQQDQFTLHRIGSIDQPLIVDVELSGLAENGKDYSAISSQLTFAEGQDTLQVPVQTLADEVSEPMELIEFRVLSSDRYEVDPAKNLAQLMIQDEALNFVDTDKDGLPDSWELAMGLNQTVDNQQGDGYKDSDGDGLNDLDEYRLGTDPMKADTDGDGIADGKDANPRDAEVMDIAGLRGYQVVQAGRDSVVNVPLGLDRIIDIPLEYLTSDGSDQANGLQLMLQYNADQLEYLGVNEVLSVSHASTGDPTSKAVYRGGYKLYTHEVPVTWDASGGDWPSMPLPTHLLNARFKVLGSAAVGQQFMVGVDAQAAESYAFKPTQFVVNVVAPRAMDILDNESDSAEEGIILARDLAGLSPEIEVTGEAKLSEVEINRISQHIRDAGLQYDVDGDGIVNPLTDAVLIYHHLKEHASSTSDEPWLDESWFDESSSESGITEELLKAVLGEDTTVTVEEVEARIREIQGGQQ